MIPALSDRFRCMVRRNRVAPGEIGECGPVATPEFFPPARSDREGIAGDRAQLELTRSIKTILFHKAFPVDIRHNLKFFCEQLAVWAQRRI